LPPADVNREPLNVNRWRRAGPNFLRLTNND